MGGSRDHGRAWWVLLPLALLAAACGEDPDPGTIPSDRPELALETSTDQLGILPFESKVITFQLRDQAGRPAARRVLRFQIDNAESKGLGASLSVERALTDSQGQVLLQVIAGRATDFNLRASANRAKDVVLRVFVDTKKRGSVAVGTRLVNPDDVTATVASVRLYFVTGQLCANVPRARPANDPTAPRVLAPGDSSVYDSVSGEDHHALFAQGLDQAGVVKADGCVDLPGSAVHAETPVRVVVPLTTLRSNPAGRYRALTLVALDQAPRATAPVLEAWNELTACETDPGRLWLDCTVDALGPETPEDPHDCLPSTADEAAFDGRLAARRGLPVAGTSGRCRQRTDGAGRSSLENQIPGAMFATPAPAKVLADLMALPGELQNLLRGFRLHSTLELTATTRSELFLVDHQLEVLEFGDSVAPVALPLWDLGLPVRSARFVQAISDGREVSFERHGFTVRLGSAARLATERGLLARRGYPADVDAFVAAAFAAARYSDRQTPLEGCSALSAMICPLVMAPEACLTLACTRGVAALGRKLGQAFDRLDGPELDGLFEGFAPILDQDGDGLGDGFGSPRPTEAQGSWGILLRTADGQHVISATFTAERQR